MPRGPDEASDEQPESVRGGAFYGGRGDEASVRRAQIENLYVEILLLLDEAQPIFADARGQLLTTGNRELAVAALAEVMITSARMTHILAWLLHQRAAIRGGEGQEFLISDSRALDKRDALMPLGDLVGTDWGVCGQLDEPIQRVIAASERLVERIVLIEKLWAETKARAPVQALLAQLEERLTASETQLPKTRS